MEFKPDFFKGEIRDGFYIDPMMKCAWAVQMDVLEDVQKLCRANNIQYFADGGTLLGTIRHQGYIPWDDDIDIAMLRPDYDRFLEIIKREWKDKYVLKIPGETGNYTMPFTKILNTDTISFEVTDLLKFHGCPYITGIDIFPLDIIPDAEGERNALIELYHFLANAIHQEKEYPEEVRDNLNIIEELCQYKIDRNDDIGKQLRMLAEMICKSYMGTDNSDLMMLSFDSNIILKKAWYQETEWKNFETMKLPVPKFYHEVLAAWYGDYMTPVQGAAQHDYPFYKKQMKLMEQNMALKKYGIDISEITKEE